MADMQIAAQLAEARRQHWLAELEAARRSGDMQAAASAQAHIDEYDALIAELTHPLPASISLRTEKQ